jgi:hypothetical protein
MSPQTLRILIAGGLFVHGIGHTLGFFKPARSWVLSSLGDQALRTSANVLWSIATIGFVLSALGFLGILVPTSLWRPLAIVFSLLSLLSLVLFIGNWPVFNTIGAVGFNLVVLIALLWLNWPPRALFGW